jgi:hypothetical protein
MSDTAFGNSRKFHKQCERCRERKARFRFRGAVRADRDHTLCFACFRSQRDRARAALQAHVSGPAPIRARPVAAPGLNARQVAHRHQMLRHLEHLSATAG